MALLQELREAAPLAQALERAVSGAAASLEAAAVAASSIQVPPPLRSSGGGEASGPSAGSSGSTGGLTTIRQIRSTDRRLIKSVDWLNEKCERTTFQIPNPRNPHAAAENDMVSLGGWDCSGELHMEADFYDPDEWAQLKGHTLRSSTSSGGGGHRSAPPKGHRVLNQGPHEVGGATFGSTSDGSTVGGTIALRPDPSVARALDAQTALLREIRDQGRQDAGLGRRVGGRP